MFVARGSGHFFSMMYEGKRDVLSYRERIVKRRMLKQEAHLLPDLSHPVKSQIDDILAVDANRSRVGRFQADDNPQQHLFPVPLRPSTARVSPRFTLRLIH